MAEHLGHDRVERSASGNVRNGSSRKTIRTDIGDVRIGEPRDRAGSFTTAVVSGAADRRDRAEDPGQAGGEPAGLRSHGHHRRRRTRRSRPVGRPGRGRGRQAMDEHAHRTAQPRRGRRVHRLPRRPERPARGDRRDLPAGYGANLRGATWSAEPEREVPAGGAPAGTSRPSGPPP